MRGVAASEEFITNPTDTSGMNWGCLGGGVEVIRSQGYFFFSRSFSQAFLTIFEAFLI